MKKISFLLCALLCFMPLAHSRRAHAELRPFLFTAARPDDFVPLDSWTYAVLEELEEIQYARACSLRRRDKTQSFTRYDFAVTTLRWSQNRHYFFTDSRQETPDAAAMEDAIAALTREFQPEIDRIILPPFK